MTWMLRINQYLIESPALLRAIEESVSNLEHDPHPVESVSSGLESTDIIKQSSKNWQWIKKIHYFSIVY